MSKNEIKLGKSFHYKKEENSGFWISQIPVDPHSMTLTSGELKHLVLGYITYLKLYVNDCEEFIKEL